MNAIEEELNNLKKITTNKIDDNKIEKKKIFNLIKNEVDEFDQISYLLSNEKKIANELKNELNFITDNQVLIQNILSELNFETIIALIREIDKANFNPIIVLTKDPYVSFKRKIQNTKINIENITFIDTISKSFMKNNIEKNVYYVDSLQNLTQLQIVCTKIINENQKSQFIFDSIDVLELFHSDEIIIKFFYSFTRLMNSKNKNCYYLLNNHKLVSKINQFFDKLTVIEKI
ncbi:MAG: hypothetical protein PHQ98_02445 [Candidatus ainarchaeum sp.]|nr:hypothetical protein [Candidatus ainarchaeum sp.]